MPSMASALRAALLLKMAILPSCPRERGKQVLGLYEELAGLAADEPLDRDERQNFTTSTQFAS